MKIKLITILIAVATVLVSCDMDNNPVNTEEKNSEFIQVVEGNGFTIALDGNGDVWAWGSNESGTLARPLDIIMNSNEALKINGISNISMISAGNRHCLALDENGSVYSWGANDHGQLGQGTRSDQNYVPSKIDYLGKVYKIYSGDDYNFTVLQNGNVYAWGLNQKGVLGSEASVESLVPGVILGLQNISKIVIDGYSCMAMDKTGKVWSWGDNSNERLGRDDDTDGYNILRLGQNDDLPYVLDIGFNRQFYVVTENNQIIEIKETVTQP